MQKHKIYSLVETKYVFHRINIYFIRTQKYLILYNFIEFYRNIDNLLEFGNRPSKFSNPLCMSLYSGIRLTSPRAATDGGVCRNRLATRRISSLVIFSEIKLIFGERFESIFVQFLRLTNGLNELFGSFSCACCQHLASNIFEHDWSRLQIHQQHRL